MLIVNADVDEPLPYHPVTIVECLLFPLLYGIVKLVRHSFPSFFPTHFGFSYIPRHLPFFPHVVCDRPSPFPQKKYNAFFSFPLCPRVSALLTAANRYLLFPPLLLGVFSFFSMGPSGIFPPTLLDMYLTGSKRLLLFQVAPHARTPFPLFPTAARRKEVLYFLHLVCAANGRFLCPVGQEAYPSLLPEVAPPFFYVRLLVRVETFFFLGQMRHLPPSF